MKGKTRTGKDTVKEEEEEKGARRGKKETCMTHATYTLSPPNRLLYHNLQRVYLVFFMKGKLQRDSYNKRELT